MKNSLLILLVSCLAVNAYAGADEFDIYRYELDKCDVEYDKEAGSAMTIAAQREAGYNQNDCYEKVGIAVIDKYYSKNQGKMKESLTGFIKANYLMNRSIYTLPDECTPMCGSMRMVVYINTAAPMLKTMVLEIIRGAKF